MAKKGIIALFLASFIFATLGILHIEVRVHENTLMPQASHRSEATNSATINADSHHPDYFSNQIPFEILRKRDNLVSVFTGCSISAWTYDGPTFRRWKVPFFDDCKCHHEERNLTARDITSSTAASLLKPGDTLYVEFTKIPHFVQHTLPRITANFVLISGQNHLIPQKPKPLTYVWDQDTFDAIINSPRITHWFLMNMNIYAQDPDHPKLHPFPYGLGSSSEKYTKDTAKVGMNPMQAFKEELSIHGIEKNNSIFAGYFSMRTNKEKRKLVPQGNKMPPSQHFRRMHESFYVVSPNGDRPDCYRHYEAIGLGSKPITQMSPKYYRHFGEHVVYNQTTWDLDELETQLSKSPQVNRRLVFEEYWMEYVERVVGRPLQWWDPSRNVRCLLAEITNEVMKAART
jgi:hypothetical protein